MKGRTLKTILSWQDRKFKKSTEKSLGLGIKFMLQAINNWRHCDGLQDQRERFSSNESMADRWSIIPWHCA